MRKVLAAKPGAVHKVNSNNIRGLPHYESVGLNQVELMAVTPNPSTALRGEV